MPPFGFLSGRYRACPPEFPCLSCKPTATIKPKLKDMDMNDEDTRARGWVAAGNPPRAA
jgi:hypothetical protein